MRRFALVVLLLSVLVAGADGPTRAAASSSAAVARAGSPRLLYTGDWSGSREIYAVDPSQVGSIAQVTFGQEPSCDPLAAACGFADVVPSPDGRHLAFQTEGLCDTALFVTSGYLDVARADGRGQRQITPIGCYATVAWAPDSRRLAYVPNPYAAAIYIVNADGSHNHLVGSGQQPAWSPDGRSLAFLSNDSLWVARNGHARVVALGVKAYAWSPSGASLAIADPQLAIIRPDGSHRRRLSDDAPRELRWSPDGRFIAYSGEESGLETIDVTRRTTRIVGAHGGREAWSRRGHLLAFDGRDGLAVFDARSGATRQLTSDHAGAIAWAPNDRSIAYLDADIRIATLSRRVRTVVSAAGTAGGWIKSLVWTRPPAGLRYRPVEPRTAATVSANELVARWPLEHLAADGSHVLYVSCGHLFVWTPASRELVQAEAVASLEPDCSTPGHYLSYDIYDVALAGDRLAFGDRSGNMSQGWELYQQLLADPAAIRRVPGNDFGYAICTVGDAGLGDLAGAGDLLVYSHWHETFPPEDCGTIVSQQIYRLDATGCPCPLIATAPGPLLPADVDGGRIVAVGANATELLDASGKQLLAVPVHALAAQLAGPDLVVVVQGPVTRLRRGHRRAHPRLAAAGCSERQPLRQPASVGMPVGATGAGGCCARARRLRARR
jgi:WD40 repeat protein